LWDEFFEKEHEFPCGKTGRDLTFVILFAGKKLKIASPK
jgi:hypothetical protein